MEDVLGERESSIWLIQNMQSHRASQEQVKPEQSQNGDKKGKAGFKKGRLAVKTFNETAGNGRMVVSSLAGSTKAMLILSGQSNITADAIKIGPSLIFERLQQVSIEENGKRFSIRSECKGVCGKVFQSVGVAMPPTMKEI